MSDKMKKSTTVRRQAIRISELEQQLAGLRKAAERVLFQKKKMPPHAMVEGSSMVVNYVLEELRQALQGGEKDH